MDLKSLRQEFDRVAEKQELSTTKYHQLIDKVEDEINSAITDLQSAADDTSSIDHKSVIKHLIDKLAAYSVKEQLKMVKKDLKVDLENYPKILGKFFETDISKAYMNVEFDSHTVNQIILNLLYHERLFDVADILLNESQEPDIFRVRSKYSEMHEILDALKARNLEPALSWMCVNRQKLHQAGSKLEFDLRRLQFLEIFKANRSEANNFAQTHLSPFVSIRSNEFLQITGCLLWPGDLETSPYSDLLSPEKWTEVSQELMVQFYSSMGMSLKNPLAVAVEAGAQGLPTFLEFANLAVISREEWAAMKEPPVDVELGKEFQFHSVFVCPVTWEQSDKKNPAVMLPCGHVFSWQFIRNVSNQWRQVFKCPTCCVLDVSAAQCRQLFL
ncbi:unnamed protein product [Lactuca virosa]|uniref:Uncharacterized protein n=1 Tax=Lactuca virosa TaxID=75947 RepID=A0AAU9ME69_9ASTR|nr:unnamed protein product [Lactuca virosa]